MRPLLTGLFLLSVHFAAHTAATQPGEDTFAFHNGSGKALSVTLSSANGVVEMTWPDLAPSAWDTALLRVRVQTTPGAIAPFVEISANGVADRQYFPSVDSGPRWLNVSFLRGRVTAGTRLSLRAEALTLSTHDATLRLFTNRIDRARSVLILAPHPDDAEIAAFGLYASRRSTVVTVTAGNAGPASYRTVVSDPPAHYQFKGRVRVIDSITVPGRAACLLSAHSTWAISMPAWRRCIRHRTK